MNKRRQFLTAMGITSGSLFSYSYLRGFRYPPFIFEPHQAPKTFSEKNFKAQLDNFIFTSTSETANRFRAYAPEPNIQLTFKNGSSVYLEFNNLAEDAILKVDSNDNFEFEENINGISRSIKITPSQKSQTISLAWKLPALENYKFAAIGDTGGDKELEWCLLRAKQLGARFLLHLGDFNYQESDYDRAIELFNNAPLPCYITIGNHDFHEDGANHQLFLDRLGPLNSAFTIGNTRFLNIDTATSFFPISGGLRGKLLKQLEKEKSINTVAFTHEPLFDPLEESSHYIDSESERNWLIQSLLSIGAKTLLSGHIHIFARQNCEGIDNIIAGQGLGHQDLIANRDYSKMVIGSVEPSGEVEFSFPNLAMPMNWHCHPRSDYVKESLIDSPHVEQIKAIQQACAETNKN